MNESWLGYLSLCCSLGLAACGGTSNGSDDGSCGQSAACGGDITGSWKVTSSCLKLELDMGAKNCPGLTQEVKQVSTSGTVSYNSDKTYDASLTVTGLVEMSVPASCLTQQSVTLTCAQLQQSLQTGEGANGFQSVSCSGSSGCTCSLELAPQNTASSGTYSTSDGIITETEAGGTPDDSSYCVQGSTLTLSAGDADPTISGSIVLTKQ